ncbi:hypothetical protein BC567DRAFT_233961 [Phyllosticta citribraziliensis]
MPMSSSNQLCLKALFFMLSKSQCSVTHTSTCPVCWALLYGIPCLLITTPSTNASSLLLRERRKYMLVLWMPPGHSFQLSILFPTTYLSVDRSSKRDAAINKPSAGISPQFRHWEAYCNAGLQGLQGSRTSR